MSNYILVVPPIKVKRFQRLLFLMSTLYFCRKKFVEVGKLAAHGINGEIHCGSVETSVVER